MNAKFLVIFITLTLAVIANCQYFSNLDGFNLPRNGKRSDDLITRLKSRNRLLHMPITFDGIYNIHRTFHRNKLRKHGKRNDDMSNLQAINLINYLASNHQVFDADSGEDNQ